jgi:hypothetical protein
MKVWLTDLMQECEEEQSQESEESLELHRHHFEEDENDNDNHLSDHSKKLPIVVFGQLQTFVNEGIFGLQFPLLVVPDKLSDSDEQEERATDAPQHEASEGHTTRPDVMLGGPTLDLRIFAHERFGIAGVLEIFAIEELQARFDQVGLGQETNNNDQHGNVSFVLLPESFLLLHKLIDKVYQRKYPPNQDWLG